jgi:hypothetical protein
MMGSPTATWPYKENMVKDIAKPGTTPERRASKMRLFHLLRHQDASGVSGTGVVAEGVEFSDGSICLKWTTKLNCTGLYRSVHELIAIHGHGGKTEVVWI